MADIQAQRSSQPAGASGAPNYQQLRKCRDSHDRVPTWSLWPLVLRIIRALFPLKAAIRNEAGASRRAESPSKTPFSRPQSVPPSPPWRPASPAWRCSRSAAAAAQFRHHPQSSWPCWAATGRHPWQAGRPGPHRAEEGRAAKTESERQKEGDLGTGNRHHRVPAEEPREPDVRTMNDTKKKKRFRAE